MSDINHTKFIVEQVNGDFELWLNIENKKIKLPALWLRERAPTEDQIDQITQQRFVNPHEFDPNIRLNQIEIKQGIIKLEFTDGYSADYQITDIAKWINSDNSYPKKSKMES
ncbi:gamma-butyrobetaine hydroxylase-like domain-containing protein [Alphaproteobacteria bacterium]|nr:gamma-butyrobetaine hydroxylase-like domain-containing protein [Alphaproteobacteria bacterium]